MIRADVPGLTNGDVKVQLIDGVSLRVSGSRSRETHCDKRACFLAERPAGSFERTFRLPDDADGSKITADVTAGVLTVTLSKITVQPPATIDIPVRSASPSSSLPSTATAPALQPEPGLPTQLETPSRLPAESPALSARGEATHTPQGDTAPVLEEEMEQ